MNTEQKKVLILANNDMGLYQFRRELLEALIGTGYQVYISLPDGPYVDKLKKLGCRFVDTPVDRRGMNPWRDLQLFRTYRKILRDVKPDVVLTYTIKPNAYGGMACRLAKVPYMANITGLGSTMQRSGLIRKFVLWLYRTGVKEARCTFFQNETNMAFMQSHKVTGKTSKLLPGSGVNFKEHSLKAYPEGETTRFLSVMRVMTDKGVRELLQCAYSVTKKHKNVQFVLAGSCDETALMPAVEQARTDGVLTYLGQSDNIPGEMAVSHCIIHPSYHEGMCNVLLEAASCGRPVIASDIPGCRETFTEGKSGLGCKPKDAQSLIQCVERFLTLSRQEQCQMGLEGRKKMEQEFGREQVVASYMDEINKIFSEGNDL